jgi:uncharacterized membrane protein
VLLVPLLVTYRIASQKAETSAVALKSPVVSLSIILGIGLGGFVDAIILHQLLQWHQMISNILQPTDFTTKSINMFWDGVFEAVSWIFTFVGVLLMWHSRKKSKFTTSTAVFGGGLLAGWGIFNLLDSIFNHFLFRLHDIRENATDSRLYNLGFLIISLLLIVIGSFLMKKSKVDS